MTRPTPEQLRQLAVRTAAHGPALRRLDPRHRSAALATAAALLADPTSDPGRRARHRLPAATGLTPPMVAWALETSLAPFTAEALFTLVRQATPPGPLQPVPPRLVTAVLAGNVFTAALRPLLLPLALGAPVVCKPSSAEAQGGATLPELFAAALAVAAPELAPALAVVTFPGGDAELEAPLIAASDAVIVYGGDATVETLRARVPATVRLLEHGHGVSAAYVGAAALADLDAATAAAATLALDVAAYDQRGCLSPQWAWVESGGAVDGRTFATLVRNALDQLGKELPRGPLPAAAGAAQMQWRGTAAVRGELFEGEGCAVAWLAGGPAPAGPGWRHLAVLDATGPDDLGRRLAPLGVHLKAIGIGGGTAVAQRLAAALPPPLAPRLCPLGTLQTPPLTWFAEGAPPLDGLLRWLRLED